MKSIFNLFNLIVVISLLGIFTSCKYQKSTSNEIDPFDNGGKERNLVVVISDIHLGMDLAYAECNKNLELLEKFLLKVKNSPNIKELVIAGDLLDEWFVPATIDTYQGKDQADFVQRIAATNKGVIDALNSIISENKIVVTYVPGNHDLTITEESVRLILPEINQKRDPQLGLGTYSPKDMPEVAIEHGHRYNFFCAPDPYSNQDIAPGTIMPPGYFFTRLAALHVAQKRPEATDVIPEVTKNTNGNESQDLIYEYWKLWAWTVNLFTIENKFDENIFVTNVNGLTGTYSLNDILPFQKTPGGYIDVKLYKGIQDNWDQRQVYNNVSVPVSASQAITNAASDTETDNQAKIQYFLNPNSNVRIVIFGHSHVPVMVTSESDKGQKCIYANSGTWIDHNPNRTTCNFVVITPQSKDTSSSTHVKLYNFENEIVTLMAQDSLRF